MTGWRFRRAGRAVVIAVSVVVFAELGYHLALYVTGPPLLAFRCPGPPFDAQPQSCTAIPITQFPWATVGLVVGALVGVAFAAVLGFWVRYRVSRRSDSN